MVAHHDMQLTIDRAEIQNVLARYCRGIESLTRNLLSNTSHL